VVYYTNYYDGKVCMGDIMEEYTKMVEFLGRVLGSNCEVVLQDLRKGKNCIIAIANGQISGRKIGSPLTDFGRQILADSSWKGRDYYDNYRGVTKDNRPLRSSTFLIKEGPKLVGMLCVNIDESRYMALSEALLQLGGIRLESSDVASASGAVPATETGAVAQTTGAEVFYEDADEVIESIIGEYCQKFGTNSASRLTQSEKVDIVRKLNEKRVFMIKGAVNQVAGKLGISVASLYRYLSMITRERSLEGVVSAS
jgi:predicted transcriptional regulator YheO